jgi:hypothetical protein
MEKDGKIAGFAPAQFFIPHSCVNMVPVSAWNEAGSGLPFAVTVCGG